MCEKGEFAMKKLLVDAITGLDADIIENYYEMDEKYAKNISFRLNYNHLAVAACAVLVFGAALSIPKFISPGINDPSVPPVVSTEGEESEETDAKYSGVEFPDEHIPSAIIAYQSKLIYDLKDEYVELKIYFGSPKNSALSSSIMKIGIVLKNYDNDLFSAGPYETYIAKEVDAKEFCKDDKYRYDFIGQSAPGGKHSIEFNHYETIKIPTNLFKSNVGSYISLFCVYEGANDLTEFSSPIRLDYHIDGDSIIFDQTNKIDASHADNYYVENFVKKGE